MIRKLFLLAVIAVFFLYFSFQKMLAGFAAKGIEAAVGVPVKLSRLHIKLAPFEAGLYGLKLGNPPGFQEPYLADIPEIFIRMNLAAILKGKIHVQKVILNMKEVRVERTRENQFNLNKLMKISKAKQAEAQSPPPMEEPGKERPSKPSKPAKQIPLEIDEVLLNIGKVSFVDYGQDPPVTREFGFEIKDMVLRDVADPFELTAQIIVIILKKIGFAAMNIQVDNFGVQANELMNQAKTALQNLFK